MAGRYARTEAESRAELDWRTAGTPVSFVAWLDGYRGLGTIVRMRCLAERHAPSTFHQTLYGMIKKGRFCPLCAKKGVDL